jgi:hypothetical protein
MVVGFAFGAMIERIVVACAVAVAFAVDLIVLDFVAN